MRIALFASDEVGLRISAFLGASGDLACLILDSKNPKGLNDDIQIASRVADAARLFTESSLREGEHRERFEALSVDLGIMAWWPYIIDEPLLQIPHLGMLNIHPSLLPFDRGKDPNFWCLVEGSPFGVTLHHIDTKIDTGPIAFQTRVHYTWEDTGKTLYEKAREAAVALFIDSYPAIKAGAIPHLPQDEEQATFHTRSQLESASHILLDEPCTPRELLNLLRARTFPPHPGAWFIEDDERYEVQIEIKKSPRSPENPPSIT